TEKHSRVLILLDVSPSMYKSDDVDNDGTKKPQTRMQKVIDFLTDDKVAFIQNLTKQNPVVVYRFGTRLDEETRPLAGAEDANLSKADWDAFGSYDFRRWIVRGMSSDGQGLVRGSAAYAGTEPGNADWAMVWLKKADDEVIPAGLTPDDL